ncbi:MAG: LicD family protein [Eubacterium sp.]|nr:LicD family protein [Eubacterium sp.]
MNATQKHLFKLICEIDDICKKYDIEYFMDYGTALGAIRHEGFIPWDDDLDIMLTEENYYKWVEACKKELDPKKRVYSDVRLDREFPTVFGRYNDCESARVGQKSEFWKPICGQCIDVFYLLELPGDPVKKQEAIDRYYAYDEYSNSSYRHFRMKTENWMKLYKRYTRLGKIFGKERVLRHLEKKIFHQHYDDCDTYICTSARKKGPSSIVPKMCYDSVYMADFEGRKLPIPGNYVELLNTYYEDTYCDIPEHKKRHSKMSYAGIECEAYVSDYMRLIDKDKMLRERQEFKDIAVEEGYRITRHSQWAYEKLAMCELLKIQNQIKEKNLNVKELMVSNDHEKLAQLDALFHDYYEKQMNSSVRSWDAYFDFPDELIEAALYNLIYYRNDYYTVAKILDLRKTAGKSMTKIMEQLWDCVLTTRKIKAQIIYGNLEEAKKWVDYGLQHYADCREIKICELNLDVQLAKTPEDIAKANQYADELLALYEGDDQCLKAKGDLAFAAGDKEKAKEYYDDLMENSINGMIHMDIRRKLRDE